jgi:hypothetical protein
MKSSKRNMEQQPACGNRCRLSRKRHLNKRGSFKEKKKKKRRKKEKKRNPSDNQDHIEEPFGRVTKILK